MGYTLFLYSQLKNLVISAVHLGKKKNFSDLPFPFSCHSLQAPWNCKCS